MKKYYVSRWDFIRPIISGKKVLDVGPAELVGTINKEKMERWLHGKMAEEANSILGLEINHEQVEAFRKLNYNIIQGSAEDFELEQRFDVIVAGELIEHLSNPGMFLEKVKKHLKKDGSLILTTPNRFSAITFFDALIKNRIPSYDKEIAKHVFYLDENCLTDLLVRHGFKNIEIAKCLWVGKPSKNYLKIMIYKFIKIFRPKFMDTLLVTAQK